MVTHILAPSGAVSDISPVVGLANIFSLDWGSMISTHCTSLYGGGGGGGGGG